MMGYYNKCVVVSAKIQVTLVNRGSQGNNVLFLQFYDSADGTVNIPSNLDQCYEYPHVVYKVLQGDRATVTIKSNLSVRKKAEISLGAMLRDDAFKSTTAASPTFQQLVRIGCMSFDDVIDPASCEIQFKMVQKVVFFDPILFGQS